MFLNDNIVYQYKPKGKPKNEAKPKPKDEAKPKPKPKSKPKFKPKPRPKDESKPRSKPKPKPKNEPKPRPRPKDELKNQMKYKVNLKDELKVKKDLYFLKDSSSNLIPKSERKKVSEIINSYLEKNSMYSLLNIKPYDMENADINEVVENINFQYNLQNVI